MLSQDIELLRVMYNEIALRVANIEAKLNNMNKPQQPVVNVYQQNSGKKKRK